LKRDQASGSATRRYRMPLAGLQVVSLEALVGGDRGIAIRDCDQRACPVGQFASCPCGPRKQRTHTGSRKSFSWGEREPLLTSKAVTATTAEIGMVLR
jgi:hypothetical protein